ncbi:MAG TPA: adenylyltransferase/cytidyltransferase family protein [Candidatus Woesearchaeota archaeon]|jgi:rfaE bifunctional protein nucleotidyltransferase chain/domain|nr:adenylyltransferase/cytidyltransferase family protein [Flavobacteriales bacterium]HJN57210.1 adenylyltransferase/cytidyltransferase family protein [Candidatus Woesearchaeota archaeon]
MIKTSGAYGSENILEEKELKEKLLELKSQNRKIGLCVGSFDLLHPGHMAHFRSAKKHCDVLIVGITSDKFSSQRKSEGRPIYDEKLRAFSVSQLKPVNYVFISNYLTANECIMLVKPDVYIKGPDYENKVDDEIDSERDSVKKAGGKIIYTKDEKLSTTEIIKYIQKLK